MQSIGSEQAEKRGVCINAIFLQVVAKLFYSLVVRKIE
jgi:hypothetical protein